MNLQDCKKEVVELLRQKIRNYELTDSHSNIIEAILYNLFAAHTEADLKPYRGSYDNQKGIHFWGTTGIGKTTIFKAVAEWSKERLEKPLKYIPITTLHSKCLEASSTFPMEWYLSGNVVLGDVGAEPVKSMMYGTEFYCFEEFITQRYELLHNKPHTKGHLFIECNLSIEDIAKRYGSPRLTSRLHGLLNVDKLIGLQKDYRKNG